METSRQKFKILVADDSLVYRKLVQNTLAQDEYSVSFASNGCEAKDLLATEHPAVVITDWEMPDVNGIELCRQIRRDESSYTYVILLTSHTDKTQIVEGLAAGADDWRGTRIFWSPRLHDEGHCLPLKKGAAVPAAPR